MDASMTNLQMYFWFGVPWITLLEIAAIIVDYRQFRKLIARLEAIFPGKR
jgi:hypothetical protein